MLNNRRSCVVMCVRFICFGHFRFFMMESVAFFENDLSQFVVFFWKTILHNSLFFLDTSYVFHFFELS